jgi:hypothetical protein
MEAVYDGAVAAVAGRCGRFATAGGAKRRGRNAGSGRWLVERRQAMAQNGFAIFFLLVLACGVAMLVRTAAASFAAVASALLGADPAEEQPRRYTLRRRRPADLPRIARRLRLRVAMDLRPPARPARIWAYERPDPAA